MIAGVAWLQGHEQEALMTEFNAALIREKISFASQDDAQSTEAGNEDLPLVRSNRVSLDLRYNEIKESVVVRGHSMHATLRLAARLVQEYHRTAGYCVRDEFFKWQPLWEAVQTSYDRKYVQTPWAAIYVAGESIFRTAETPVVDVVEKCALIADSNYDDALQVTEQALNRLGKNVRIAHTSNVAGVFTGSGEMVRCSLIHRSRGGDSLFSLTASGVVRLYSGVAQALCTAAAFLEGLDLRYTLRTARENLQNLEEEAAAREKLKIQHSMARQVALMSEISLLEQVYNVKYRPEKPDFIKA